MRTLELFSGTGSFTKAVLEFYDHEAACVDIIERPESLNSPRVSYYQMDVMDFPFTDFDPDYFDYVWASPPCTTYSTASFTQGLRKNCLAVTPKASLHDSYVMRAMDIIKYFGAGVVEGPRACLRKQPWIHHLDRYTVTYCQYGATNMKPTDLFFYPQKPIHFEARMCKNGDPCHVAGPRGSKTAGSTQGMKKHLRGVVPHKLCQELLYALNNYVWSWSGN